MEHLLTPAYAYPIVGIVVAVALVAFGMFARGAVTKTRVVERRIIPPELSRMAQNLRITEDIPVTESYGRRIHDMFEEKNTEALVLRADLEDERINSDSWQKEAERYQAKYEAKMEQLTEFVQAQPTEVFSAVIGEWEPKGATMDDLAEQRRKANEAQIARNAASAAAYAKAKEEATKNAPEGVVTFHDPSKPDFKWTLDPKGCTTTDKDLMDCCELDVVFKRQSEWPMSGTRFYHVTYNGTLLHYTGKGYQCDRLGKVKGLTAGFYPVLSAVSA